MYRGSTLILDRTTKFHTSDVHFSGNFGYGINERSVKIFIFAYTKLLCDTPFGADSKPVKVKKKFLMKLLSFPILDTIKHFAKLADDLLSKQFETGGEESQFFDDRFKDTPIFYEYHHWFTSRDPKLLRYILTFLLFGKKLDYVESSFDATAFRGWLEVEERVSKLSFSSNDVCSLRNIITAILGDIQVDYLLPRNGPGKVAEKEIRTIYDKVNYLTVSPKIAYVFHRSRPYWHEDYGFGHSHAPQHKLLPTKPARLKFVPKDVTKSRSICMEPVGNMIYQQEVLRWLSHTMDSGLISRFVDMNDQSKNQFACLIGSITGAADTIDLSSASDSVSFELVKGIFKDTPKLLMLLLATRSSSAITPDGLINLKKFAPMGSAVCFPIQCIIFTSICLYAAISQQRGLTTGDWICSRDDITNFVRDSLHRHYSIGNAYTSKYLPPVVFGDDLIIDHRSYDQVITTLTRLGFQVNESKSFSGSQSFRESCGVFVFSGEDVTPYRYRIPLLRGVSFDSSYYASLIASINNARAYGYFSIASYLQSLLTEYGFRYQIPFVTDSSAFGVLVKKINNEPTHIRFNHVRRDGGCWQIPEREVQGIGLRKIKSLKPENFDDYLYVQWWRGKVRTSVTEAFRLGVRPKPQETRLVPVWSRYEE